MKQFSKRITSILAAIMMLFNILLPSGAIAAEATRAGVGSNVIVNPTNDTNYRAILGNAVYYALVLENFNRENHIQANFAAKYYHENSQAGVEPDLAGNAGQIILAHPETKHHGNNYYVIRMGTNTSGSQTGKVTLYVGDILNNDMDNIIDQNINHSNYDYLHAVISDSSELEAQVEALLKRGDSASRSLLGENPSDHFETIPTDQYRGQSSVILDFLQYNFDDDATIYVNGDNLLAALKQTSGLKIAKKPNQTIVFNFYTATDIELCKFQVKYSDSVDFNDGQLATGLAGNSFSPSGKEGQDKAKNEWLATLAEHIVWNMPNATNVRIGTSTGIYLVPKSSAKINTFETSSGWLISRGTFKNTGAAEWHGIYGGMPSATSLSLTGKKTIEGKEPKGDEKFIFTLQRLKTNSGNQFVDIEKKSGVGPDAEQTNTNGSITYDNIKDLGDKWNVFKLTETRVHEDTEGNYTTDTTEYYIVLQVYKPSPTASIEWISTPKYYKAVERTEGYDLILTPSLYDYDANTMVEALGNNQVASDSIYLKKLNSAEDVIFDNQKVETTSVSGTKTWLDEREHNNGEEIQLTLERTIKENPTDADWETVTVADPIAFAWDGNTYTYSNLPICDGDNNEYTYRVKETAVNVTANGQTISYKMAEDPDHPNSFINTELTEVEVEKRWKKEGQEGYTTSSHTAGSVTVKLIAVRDEIGSVTTPTPTPTQTSTTTATPTPEPTQTEEMTATPTPEPEYCTITFSFDDGRRATVRVEQGKKYRFEIAQPRNAKGPMKVTYNGSVLLDKPEQSTAPAAFEFKAPEQSGITFTVKDNWWSAGDNPSVTATPVNSGRIPARAHLAFNGTVSDFDFTSTVSVGTIQDGLTPINQIIRDREYTVVDTQTLSAPSWSYQWEQLPKYKRIGDKIYKLTYYVVETTATGASENEYTTNGTESVVITNTEEETSASIRKVWSDSNNQDGVRPSSLTVALKNGDTTVTTVTLNEGNNWSATVEHLPKYSNGQLITYAWDEGSITGYTLSGTAADGTLTTLTNSHTTEKTTVKVNKVWNNQNQNAFQPASVTVNLLKNGTKIDSVELNAGNSWSYTWTELDKKANGSVIDYTVTEEPVTNYTTGISVNKKSDGTFEYDVTNTLETGDLTISKTVVSERAADASQKFTFTVTLTPAISGTYSGVTFTNGVGTVEITGSGSKTIEDLPVGTTYVVTEASVTNFSNTSKSGDSGAITTAGATASFTNTRATGDLKVSKVLISDAAADSDKEFNFTVTLGDTTINGTYGGMTFTDGVATFILKGGQNAVATGLPTDITYTVTEADATGFVQTGKTGDTGSISTTLSEAEFTNTRDKGGLVVSKVLISDRAADADQEFTFTVTLSDTSINKTYGDMAFTNGVATFTLKGGQSASAEGLPTGITYTVTEAAATGFRQTGKTGDTGTISTTASQVKFTNTRETGDLTVSKTVVSDAAADANAVFTFTVTLSDTTISKTYGDIAFANGVATFTLKGGESATASGLPTGITYTVTEASATGFRQTGKTGDTGTISTTPSEAKFTNTRETGDLEVSKTVVSDAAADANVSFTFTVTLSDTTITKTYGDMAFTNGVATFTLKGGEKATATGLPTGITYTVTEATAAGFQQTGKTGDSGTISTTKSEAKFTNTRETGDLEVSKTVVSDAAADANVSFTFTVTLSDTTISKTYGDMAFTNGVATFNLKGGEKATATGLPTGITYTVTEASATGFEQTGKTGDSGTISTTKSEAKFTNTRETGDLEVSKTVVSDAAADANVSFTFTATLSDTTISKTYGDMAFTNGVATFTLKGGEKATATGLPTGITYTVTEATATGFEQTGKTGDTGTISTTKSEAKFTNTRETGDLEVSKTVVSDAAADANVSFTFTVTLSDTTISKTYGDMAFTNGVATFTLKSGEKATATGLPTGITYTVTEASATGFEQTGVTGDSGRINTTKSEAKFTNTRETGDLEVSKTVISDAAADANVSFTFTVTLSDTTITKTYGDMAFTNGVATFTLKGGEKATATGLPTSITYTVTETNAEGFVLTGKTGDTGTISTTKSEATFTNTRDKGGLVVSKTLISDAAADKDVEFTFTVTLGDNTINGTYGDMTFTGGVATVALKGGQSASAANLPTGITYTVTEAKTTGFQQTGKTGDTGTISTTASQAKFTNTRETGDLEVSKTVLSDAAADKNAVFTFTVTLSDTTISKTYGDMAFENGVATFTLKGGDKATATGLPTGVTYTVTEADVTGFELTGKTGDTGTISTTLSEAKFTNTRETGDLTVSKTVVSAAAADKNAAFTFTVTLGDTTISKTYGDMAFTNGVATFTLKGGESASATGLPTGVTYTVTEASATGFRQTGKTGDTGTISTTLSEAKFTNTRETGNLKVSKTVVSDAAADANVSFTFTVELSDTTINGTFGDMTFVDGVANVTLKGGQSATATGLPTDITYIVTEAAAAGFRQTGKIGDTGTITTTPSEAKFTNTRETGDLEVSKTVVSDAAADANVSFTFTVTLSDTTITKTYGDMAFTNGVATFTLKGGEKATATGLPTGITYTVTEATAAGFQQTGKTGDSGTISTTKSEAKFTNTRETGDLEVSKTVVSDAAADANVSFTFTVTLSDTTISKTYGDMAFTNGVATFNLKGGEKATATGLPTGITYTVTEASATGFEQTGKTGDSGTISTTKSEAKFTNTRETGDLEVSKTVVSDAAADANVSFTFTATLSDTTISKTYGDMAFTNGVATFTLKGGEKATATGLPTGITYTVTEATATGFEQTGKTGDTGTISTTKSEAKFTNTRETGDLEVSKTVVSDAAADANVSFTFTVTLSDKTISKTYGDMAFANGVATFTLKGGQSAIATDLPTGITYTVTEATTEGFMLTGKTGDTGTISTTLSEAEFTNTRDQGGLVVSKVLVSDRAADADQEFTFTVELSDKTISGTYDDMTFANGVATFTLKGGESAEATGLPTDITYTVTEAAATGFELTGKTGVTGTISTTASQAEFTNTRETGDLTVSKTVVSDAAADANAVFTFTVELGDKTISGIYGDMTFANGVATFTLKGGESAEATGLPTEITYTVTEAAATGFELTGKTGDTGIISTTPSEAKFTNTRETGDLTVSKTVLSDAAADQNVSFTFTVELSDTTISKTYGDMAFANGVATFTLKGGQSATASGLPTGITYTVTETVAAGFQMTGHTGDSGTISTILSEAKFTNTRDQGGLKVSKTLISDRAADADQEFTFTVELSDKTISKTYGDMAFTNGVATFTLKGGEEAVATGLPTGITYTVTEAAATGFELTGKTDDTGTISATQSIAVFTNTRETGDLTVGKAVVSEAAADKDASFTFTVTLGDTTINGAYGGMTFADGVATFTLKGGESKTATGLPTDVTYTVTEAAAAGFRMTGKTGNEGTISKTAATAAFENTRETGDLKVSKEVLSDATADKDVAFEFTVTLDDNTINGTYGGMTFENGVATFTLKDSEFKTATGLPTSIGYTVTEASATGFQMTGKTGDEGAISTTLSEAKFTNTRDKGGLKVSKEVISDAAADKNVSFTFTVTLGDTTISGTYGGMTFENGVATFTLKGGESKTATGLPTDVTYEVTEASAEGFVQTGKTGDTGSISTTQSEAKFTNTRDQGGLVVSKILVSDRAADADTEFEFTVTLNDTTISKTYGDMTFVEGVATFTLKGGESAEATGLPTGITYTVTEKDATGFELTGHTGDSGTISTTASKAEFTNTRETGNLTVSKSVLSDAAADRNVSFTFTVTLGDNTISGTYGGMTFAGGVATFTLKGGESATATGLPTEVTYTVTEDTAEGFQLTGKTGDTGTISTTASTAAFTNTRDKGGLKVSKTVISDAAADADAEFEFTVTLSDKTISGTYGDMAFAGGVATFTLKGGESAEATGLPTGITYTVTEADAEGFELTGKTGDTGTISTTQSEAKFTNTREVGDLKVSKTVLSDAAADANVSFTFTVELSDKTISKTYGDMAFANGVATFTLKGGESKTATGLPTDITYTVTEEDAAGFQMTGHTGDSGTISTTLSEAKFTNTRETGDLKVSKTVLSDAAADQNVSFTFTVELSDKTISKTYGDMAFANGVATFTLKGGQSATATGLPTGITYTVTETAAAGFQMTGHTGDSGTISTTLSEAKFTNTRDQGGLKVSKVLISDRAADADQEFTYTVTLSDTTISKTYGDMAFENGVATFTLKGGEDAVATGLPTGITYTVTEADADGFELTGTTDDTGTISTTQSTAVFTNTRETGDLTVSKEVLSERAADADQKFTFTVTLSDKTISGTYGDMTFAGGVATVTLKGGESATASGLPTEIDYTVTETEATGFELTGKTGDTGSISTTASTAAFTNTRETGDLKVSKTVVSDAAADKNVAFTFTVELGDDTINGTYGNMDFTDGVATFTLKDGESATATGLPTDITYTVTEATAEGFMLTGKTGDSGTISTTLSEAKFTNTRDQGGLVVSKVLVSDRAADTDQEFSFTVELSDKTINGTYGDMTFANGVATFNLKGGESAEATGLPTEITYTVTEAAATGFQLTGKTGETGAISTTASQAEFTNTRETGDLKVSKKVLSDAAADKDAVFTFTVELGDKTISGTYGGMTFADGVATFTLKGGESKTASGLPTDITYTVTEADAEGFELTGKTGDTGTISTTLSEAKFTNTREVGDLTVSKTVLSDATADQNVSFTFTVELSDKTISKTYGDMTFVDGVATFTLKGGESATANGLPTDITYTVTETAAEGFQMTGHTGDSGTISTTASTAAFTNTRDQGGLTVSKVLISDRAADADQEFTFTVELSDKTISKTYGDMTFENGVATFTLKGGESAEATGLPTDITYTVTEAAATGFELTGKTGDTGTISTTAGTAVFTNTRDTGDLTVSKTVVSDAAADKDAVFTFTVELSDKTINKTYGDMAFANGVATFTLKGGESKTASDLPTDITYTVTEAAAAGFQLTGKTGDTGTISTTASTAVFTNTREVGNLTVSKTVLSDAAADADAEFTFTVTLNDKTISKTYGDMTFENGVATVTLKGGESATATGLPTGVTYTVTEAAAEGFELSGKTGDTGTISTTASEAVFTNARETGGLELNKKLVSDRAADADQVFTFTVTLSDTTISKTYGDMTFENGVATVTLKGGEKATATGMPTEIGYTITEADAAGFQLTGKTGDTGTISTSKSVAVFTNTRETGNLTLSKELVSDRAADANQVFTFTVTLSDTTISKTYGDMAFENGVATVTLKGGESAAATGLPTEIDYAITEAAATGFLQTGKTGDTGSISTTASTAVFTNTRETGDLTLSKILVSDRTADADQEFTFTVTLSDTTISKTYGDMTFENGSATVTLKGGESATANGLPTAIDYTITEAAAESFQLTGKTGDSGTISTTASTATFTNTRETGGLTLSKVLVSDRAADADQEFTFTVTLSDTTISGTYGDMALTDGVATVTLKGGESAAATGLPTEIDYSITEAAAEGFRLTGKTGDTGSISTTASTATFTNTRETGDLTLSKELVSDRAADADQEFTFTVTLSDTTISKTYGDMTFENGAATVTLKGGESATATGLPTEIDYTITEAAATGFRQTGKTGDTGSISTTASTAVFTNTRETGDLTLSKVLVSDRAADADQEFTFTVTLSDTTISKTYGDMTFTAGKATVTLKGGESATATGLPTEIDYTITEAAAEGFQLTGKTGDEGSITTTLAEATFTNTRETGGLELSKVLVSDRTADADQEFTFTVTLSDTSISGTYGDMTFAEGAATVTLKGGKSAIATGLPTEIDYTITEAAATGFRQTGKTGDTGSISTTASTAVFTNTRETGDLELSKVLVSDRAADADQAFTFTVTLGDTGISGTYGDMTFEDGVATVTLKGGESATATGLPTEITYSITEAAANGFELTGKTNDTGSISTTKSEAEFTNTRKTGDLEVRKTVPVGSNAEPDKAFAFTVTLSDTTIGGAEGKAYGEMTFKNGIATFTLTNGQTKKATGLPTDIDYTVEEETYDGFTTVPSNETGTIVQGTTNVEFVNTYSASGSFEIPGTKTIEKRTFNEEDTLSVTISSEDGNLPDEPTVNVTLTPDITYTADFSLGEITYVLADLDGEESKTFHYTVTENASMAGTDPVSLTDTFTVTVTDRGDGHLDVVPDYTQDDKVTFTNTYSSEGEIELFAKKILVRKTLTKNMFRFSLYSVDPETGAERPITTVGNDENGVVAFTNLEDLKYDQDDLADVPETTDGNGRKVKTKDLYYRIREVIPAGTEDDPRDPAMTYDLNPVDIKVTITDDLKGNIETSADPDATESDVTKITITFTNIVTRIEKLGNMPEGDDLISVKGAHLQVLLPGDDGTVPEVIDEWDTDGKPHEVEHLAINTVYTLRETVVAKYPNSDPARYYTFAGNTTFTVDKDGKITYSDGLELRGTDGTILLKDKLAEQPKFEKKIQDTNDTTGETSGWQDSADYDIGDAVPYKLWAKLADNVTDYPTYHITFHDEMEKGLTFNGIDRVTVKGEKVDANDYELTSDDHSFDLKLTWTGDETEGLNSAEVEVYFTAELNKDAVRGNTGNVNKGRLEYSCNPNVGQGGETGSTEWDSVICFTYDVAVNKVDETGEQPLAGAEFKLEKKLTGNRLEEIKRLTVTADTTFTFTGLDDGTYILTETKHPEGYKQIDPITFTVTAVHTEIWEGEERTTILTEIKGGDVKLGEIEAPEIVFTPVDGNLSVNIENESELTSATVKKVWKDGENRDGLRQPELTVYLVDDGEVTDQYVILSKDNNWIGRINDLPKMRQGKPIKYTWKEILNSEGYTEVKPHAVNGTLTTITNTYTPEETSITVRKEWVDNGTHPGEVTVQLYADGQACGDAVTLSASTGWTYTWKNLAKNRNTTPNDRVATVKAIEYTVAETVIPEGYVARVYAEGETGFVITNTLENGNLLIEKQFEIEPWEPFTPDDSPKDIPVIKTWNDDNNRDGNRPAFITVRLLADGVEVASEQLNEQNNWRTVFTGLPRLTEEKEKIVYTVTEDPVEWYETEIHGFNIRNNYKPELTSVSVKKVWDDFNDNQKLRPLSIAMTLSNGMIVVLNAENNWTATISDLPTRVNGKPVTYTWTEQKVLNYSKESEVTEGGLTTFTNKVWVRTEKTPGGKTPKTPGNPIETLPEYDTPLGLDVMINHVGDCFD